MSGMGQILLIRHGQTEWSLTGQHTGRTDMPLTAKGEADAAALAPRLAGREFALVLSSPLARASRTAELAGLDFDEDADLLEWDYGAYEGMLTTDIRAQNDPDWTIWRDPIPPGDTPGEQAEDVAVRTRRVLDRCRPHVLEGNDCAIVAHGHLLRILTATWLELPAVGGRLFELDALGMSVLSMYYRQPVVVNWNTH